MADMKNRIMNLLPSRRRLIQLYTALLYNAHAKGFITGNIYTGGSKAMCVPGLNCYSCPGAVGACPLGALQNAVASSGSRAPWYVLGIIMLFGLILGRTICGYLCPVGLVQELLHKIPVPKLKKSRVTRMLSLLKYVILAVFVIMIPLWYSLQSYPVPAFCKYICPAGTIEGAAGLLANPVNADKFSMLGLLFTRKFIILVLITAACIFIYRAFCRFICPLGAIYGLFSKVAVIGVKVEVSKCTDCGRCVGRCPMDIRSVGDRECIHCGECIDSCPTGAIEFKAGKLTLRGREAASPKHTSGPIARIAAWTAAAVILVGAFLYFNSASPSDNKIPDAPPAETAQNDVPTGSEVGMAAPDFTVPVYGTGETFTLSEYRGKTVVVNFWATWCTPCCEELPHFNEVYLGDDAVEVIAIHSNLVTDDVEGYLSNYDYSLPFALDTTGEVIASFGGSTMLPQTVVIDADGIITYNSVGSVTTEKLLSLISEARK